VGKGGKEFRASKSIDEKVETLSLRELKISEDYEKDSSIPNMYRRGYKIGRSPTNKKDSSPLSLVTEKDIDIEDIGIEDMSFDMAILWFNKNAKKVRIYIYPNRYVSSVLKKV
jgi:hypothetical protein